MPQLQETHQRHTARTTLQTLVLTYWRAPAEVHTRHLLFKDTQNTTTRQQSHFLSTWAARGLPQHNKPQTRGRGITCTLLVKMSSIGFENLRPRKTPMENGVEVAFSDAPQDVEMTAFGPLEDEQKAVEVDHEESELTDQETGDQSSLIQSQDGVDSDGVVREYEVALKHLGFGAFHILLLMINGTALLSDAIEVLSISFVLPVLNRPEEYGVGDTEEAVLSSIIFVGMLFGSYVWGSSADLIGRRTTIVASLTVSAAFGIFSAFAPWFWLFVLFRFFSGFG